MAALWIKRDDLTEFLLSGNKARKLQFLIADAVQRRCDTVVTIGGIQSNHARATAVAARIAGLDSHLILRIEDPTITKVPSDYTNLVGNMFINRLVDSHIHLVTKGEYAKQGYRALLSKVGTKLTQEGKRPYIIPVGGSNILGIWGYISFVHELETQMEDHKIQFDDIVFACGSGGTAAGLAAGLHLSGLHARGMRLHAFAVCDNADYFYAHIDEALAQLKIPTKARDLVNVVEGYKGAGYTVSTQQELELLRDVAADSGIVLDPVYTVKAFNGMLTEHHQKGLFRNRRVLFIHTGGTLALYDKVQQLELLLPAAHVTPLFP